MLNNCLLIKPHPISADSLLRQQKDIKNVIRPAIKQAGLSVLGGDEGVEINDITLSLVQQIYEAEIVVVDANHYENAESLSPYLYYFIGLRHTLGTQTILVTRSTVHLPNDLRKHHTLIYSPEDMWKFFDEFEHAVKAIQASEESRPDNPIQEYFRELKAKAQATELAKTKAQVAAIEAQIQALQQGTTTQKIIFRRVAKPERS